MPLGSVTVMSDDVLLQIIVHPEGKELSIIFVDEVILTTSGLAPETQPLFILIA